MTIVVLPDDRPEAAGAQRASGGTALRTWLADRWAILFSHPEDFAQEQLEMDRWISIVSHSFSARGIAPIALLRAGQDPEEGWLGRLAASGRHYAAALSLATRGSAAGGPADLAARALRADLARSGPRFAMIIDSNLRRRRTLSYRLPSEPPSPLELVGWAVALRKRDRAEDSPREAPQASPPFRAEWARVETASH